MFRTSITLVVSLAFAGQTGMLPQFDVASVKPNTLLEQPSNNWHVTPGQTDFHNSQLVELIRLAWGDFQLRIENGPDWLARGRFDIVVQYPVDTPRDVQSQMMRALLTERFKLAAHLETREVPTYSLVMARADRRPGSRLGSPLPECPLANGTIPPPGSPPQCGPGTSIGGMKFGNIRIPNIALYLSRVVGRRVTDNTGLTESYRIDLRYTPPAPLTPPTADPTRAAPAPPLPDPDAPDVFVALQEQLGLKLEDAKGQIQVLVIDHIEQPSAN